MCMKNYNAEKIIFDKFTAFFNFAIFRLLLTYILCEIIFRLLLTYILCVCLHTYFVKSTPPRAFSISFQYFADMLQTY